jgi:hypothetical protein
MLGMSARSKSRATPPVDVPVAADVIADAAGLAGEGTNFLPRIFTDNEKGHA